MAWFKSILIKFFSHLFSAKVQLPVTEREYLSDKWTASYVNEEPEYLASNRVYIVGNKTTHNFWYAYMVCPCGCEERIMLNLINDVEPKWKVSLNKGEDHASIYPSIWRNEGCESHFWIKNGNIVWA